MNRILIYLILVIFLFVNHSITFGQAVRIDTLSLEFDQVHLPPFCFTPHKIIKIPKIGLA